MHDAVKKEKKKLCPRGLPIFCYKKFCTTDDYEECNLTVYFEEHVWTDEDRDDSD